MSDAPANASQDPKVAHLLRWLEEGGARFPKLRITVQENGERAVIAREPITTGETVVTLPKSHLITQTLARGSELGRLLQSEVNPDNEEMYLALFLLEEKHKPDSFWRPYIDSLPESFPHLPLFFDEQEQALLQGSFLMQLLVFQAQSFQQEYALLCQKVPGFSRYTAQEFVWARLSVSSRVFGLKVGGLLGQCLVPLADMFNHRRPPDVLWSTSEDGETFEMTAMNAVAPGLEVHDSYGAKSNDLMLLHYGFLPENNEEDEVFLLFGIPEGDVLAAGKQQMLGLSSPTAKRPFKVPRKYEHPMTRWMFSFLRVALAAPTDLPQLAAKVSGGLQTLGPLGVDNEERVLSTLGAVCEARLAAFGIPLEEDERLLREAALTPNARNCIRLRRAEKRLLHAYLDLTRTCLPLLRKPRAELDALAGGSESPWGWFDGYVRSTVLELVA